MKPVAAAMDGVNLPLVMMTMGALGQVIEFAPGRFKAAARACF